MNETFFSNWTILCDFDGTISHQDVTDTLLVRYGRPGWEALEEAWQRGEIGSRECMRRQVALLDMSAADLHSSLNQITIDPGFHRFVQHAFQLGMEVCVVSDGLDHAISTVLSREGLGQIPIVANQLLPSGFRCWKLETPWAQAGCASANCKCGQLNDHQKAGKRVLYVGDGTSDYCVSANADYVLAKSRLLEYCRNNGIPHAAFIDFDEALLRLSSLPTRREERWLA